ncbi:anthocyanidin 3-o-glucoside 2''-o-glucosyltransferase [Quercus suber]|uniref:Anthocyanidin 3-o-glucoside 2''-o-glucosyltransferase n=1 Tax=Quercus suber TaxID=58331 RepID=A0AAW0L3B0_QUESU
MGRGKYKNKPTGKRQFSTPEDILAGTSTRPRTFRQHEAEHEEEESREESDEGSEEESGEESEESLEKRKGTQGIIEIENPNLVKPKSVKARDVDLGKTTELSRRERFSVYPLYVNKGQKLLESEKKKKLKMSDKSFHIVMYPWFAMGHLTSVLHISNKLAERGHRVSFLLPTNTQAKLEPFNLHKNLISFIPITVPHVDGLPPGSETTSDVPFPLHSLIMTAMDLTAPSTEYFLRGLKPHFVFHDFTHWLPPLARRLGIKSIHHCIISPATVGYLLSPERKINEKPLTEADFKAPPPSFPPSSIKLFPHEVRQVTSATLKQFGRGI